MNKAKKIFSSVITVCLLILSAITVFAASESLDGSRCSWYGGIESDTIYSKVWDHERDGRRYTVTVWVKDDKGDTDSRTGTTSGVDEDGEVIITKTATYDNPLAPNKCGYKDFSIVD